MADESRIGTVYLVGAGPGDPGLLTLRGAELLQIAEAVVHDALVNPAILDRASPLARRYDVGRRVGEKLIGLDDVSALLINLAKKHRTIVRLKGGDPFVFGRGGEEAIALHEAGVPFEVVPGVTSGVAALAYAGIPLTHRGVSASATFLTGHRVFADVPTPDDALPGDQEGTLVVYMGLAKVAQIAEELIRRGRDPLTPAAVVESGTYPTQRTVTGTLQDIAVRTVAAGITGPALIVVGGVVALREKIRWFEEERR
jgi:uroporphyrinogen III methyltransferase/synthase